jgi:Ca2+-transporting ATPase
MPTRRRPQPGGNDVPWLYSGSLVIRGSGIALVRATGAATEIGRIGLAVSTLETEQPRLQAQTRRVVVAFGVAGIAVSTVAVILHGLLRGSWLEALLGGIALGMSMLPEEFPLVLTVFTVMGAWRLSQSRVLTRRAAAIDTLGAATVLCTDKTGTLTHNRMSVVALRSADENWRDGGAIDAIAGSAQLTLLLETARLAGDLEAPDPMERALVDAGRRRQRTGEPGYPRARIPAAARAARKDACMARRPWRPDHRLQGRARSRCKRCAG